MLLEEALNNWIESSEKSFKSSLVRLLEVILPADSTARPLTVIPEVTFSKFPFTSVTNTDFPVASETEVAALSTSLNSFVIMPQPPPFRRLRSQFFPTCPKIRGLAYSPAALSAISRIRSKSLHQTSAPAADYFQRTICPSHAEIRECSGA